jgi:hypothetical protein
MFTTKFEVSVTYVMRNMSAIVSTMPTTATPIGSNAASRPPKMRTSAMNSSGKTMPSAFETSLAALSMFSRHIIEVPPTLTLTPSTVPV